MVDEPCETSHIEASQIMSEVLFSFFLSIICLIYLHDQETKPIDLKWMRAA